MTKSTKRKANNKVVFVVCPGASSKDPTELQDALKDLGSTVALPKWKGMMPAHQKANVQLVVELCEQTAQKHPDRKIVLVGHSFGTRIILALLSLQAKGELETSLPESVVTDRAIFESYPLYSPSKPKPTTDRAIPLQKAPPTLHCLFVSGDKDDFLDRRKNWRGADAVVGSEALQEVVKTMPNRDLCSVTIISGSKHNALKTTKARQADAVEQFQNAIRELLEPIVELSSEAKPITSFFQPSKKAKTSK